MADTGKSSLGMDANIAGLLSYTLGVVTGLVFFLLEKESTFVKFHAMQSILFSVGMFVVSLALSLLPVVGWFLLPLAQLGGLVVWVILMVKAYQDERFQLPLIGEIAAKQAGGIDPGPTA